MLQFNHQPANNPIEIRGVRANGKRQTANVCPILSIDGEVRGYSKHVEASRFQDEQFAFHWMDDLGMAFGGHAYQKPTCCVILPVGEITRN